MLPEKGGEKCPSENQKSHPESDVAVVRCQGGDLDRGEDKEKGACHHNCHPGCSAGSIVLGLPRDQTETQKQHALDRCQL